MSYLWNASTTIRNSNRLINFLSTALQIENEEWNNDTQVRYQALLIQNRFYSPKKYHPFMDNEPLTYEQALEIFNYQDYTDPPMRGRVSLDPLKKFGFVDIINGRVTITRRGLLFLESNTTLTGPMLEWRFTYNNANVRPFVILLKFLYELKNEYNINNITFEEFGLFVMTINDVTEIYNNKLLLIQSRHNQVISNNLTTIHNINNLEDYLDNNIRYFRQSNLIIFDNNTISLNHNHIDLINCILTTYDGTASQNI